MRKHESMFRELRDRILILYEYLLAPAQTILPDDANLIGHFEPFAAGRYFKYPGDVAKMKILQN